MRALLLLLLLARVPTALAALARAPTAARPPPPTTPLLALAWRGAWVFSRVGVAGQDAGSGIGSDGVSVGDGGRGAEADGVCAERGRGMGRLSSCPRSHLSCRAQFAAGAARGAAARPPGIVGWLFSRPRAELRDGSEAEGDDGVLLLWSSSWSSFCSLLLGRTRLMDGADEILGIGKVVAEERVLGWWGMARRERGAS